MLVQCNKKCQTTVNALLNTDTDEVICTDCGDVLDGVSSYSKLSMKISGDVLRSKNRKAFMFNCETCDKVVETTFVNSKLTGKTCPNDTNGCKINVTKHMVKAIAQTEEYLSKMKEHDEPG